MGAVVVRDLTKKQGKKLVFDSINFEVNEGEIYALLALNGQGKTTLARTLFNFIKPNSGDGYIFDMDIDKDSKQIKEIVSYVPQDLLYQDNVKAVTLLKKTLSSRKMKNTDEMYYLADYFDFNVKTRISDMTDNEKKLFSIINALMIKPRLVILDEPSKYLNLVQQSKLYEHLKKLRQEEGMTVFILTDSLIEAQNYCDRAVYLHEGEIKDIEYLNDKVANDKIVKIYSPVSDLEDFTSIGARVIKDSYEEKVLYYDQDLVLLSKLIAVLEIDNYSIEDSSLSDKIAAYYTKGVEPRKKRPGEIQQEENYAAHKAAENSSDETVIISGPEDIPVSEEKTETEETAVITEPAEENNNSETVILHEEIITPKASNDMETSEENKEDEKKTLSDTVSSQETAVYEPVKTENDNKEVE